MLDTLKRVCEDGGRLVKVLGTQFISDAGEPPWITAVALQFETLTSVFRVVETDDTLADSMGSLTAEADEEILDLSSQAPWASCLGLQVQWGWQLTNQQGYMDGVRLEFSQPSQTPSRIVELIAIASRIQVFEAELCRPPKGSANG